MAKRVVLAYSGGLDTSVAVRWMIEEWGVEVVCVLVDVGQDADSSESFDDIKARALAAGALDCVVVDARDEMAEEFCAKAILANARYEGKYPLVSALSRPVIVRHLVAQARKFDASAVAHGCTGKGNDQVRFEVGTHALAPDLEVLAPARNWGMTPRRLGGLRHEVGDPHPGHQGEDLLDRREPLGPRHRVRRHGGPLGGAARGADDADAGRSDEPVELTLASPPGCRSPIDGVAMPLADLIKTAQRPGRLDRVSAVSTWWRTVGWASRVARSTSARRLSRIIAAHADLEDLVLERDVHHEKARLETRWAELGL